MVSYIVSCARRNEEIALGLLDLQRLGLQRRKILLKLCIQGGHLDGIRILGAQGKRKQRKKDYED